MRFYVQYVAPQIPAIQRMGEVPVYWFRSKEPLSYVGISWSAPSLRTYPAGLRRLLLRLLTEENAHYPVGQLAERLHRLGWDMGWGSNRDSIFLTAEGLTENLSSALGLLYEAVAYPTLSGPAVSHHLNRLIEAETRSRANPTYQADATLQHYLWGQSYRITAYESIETLRRIDTTLLTSYYEHFIRKGLNGVVIAAPYLPESLYKWSAWIGSVAYTMPLSLQMPEVCEALPFPNAKQVSLRIAYPWVRPIHDLYGYYRMALMRLGGYFGAQLMRSVREEAGLTYGIHAYPDNCVAGSYIVISTEVAKERASEAVSRIHTEVERWSKNPFPTEDILIEVRNYLLLHSMPETLNEWADRVLRIVAAGFGPEKVIQHAQQVNAISNLSDFPFIDLPTHPVVQVAVGAEASIFAAECV